VEVKEVVISLRSFEGVEVEREMGLKVVMIERKE
jgi:hypothetical protein